MKQVILIAALFFLISNISSAQCTVNTTGGSIAVVPGLWGQGFTSTCNGYIDYVAFKSFSSGVVNGDTLRIYNGNNVSSSPIYQQYFSNINIANNGDLILINLSGSVPVLNGNQYTFEFNPDNIPLRALPTSYLGGEAFRDGSTAGLDLEFEVGITSTVGVNEIISSDFSLIPNPTSGQLTISLEEASTGVLSIRNYLGQLVMKEEFNNTQELDVSLDGSPGIYFLQVESDGKIITKKVVKE